MVPKRAGTNDPRDTKDPSKKKTKKKKQQQQQHKIFQTRRPQMTVSMGLTVSR